MKHIYAFLLFAVSGLCMASCNDDKRDIVFFSGDEPVYENGTCTNLLSQVGLYTIQREETIVGIDGGDGDYSIAGDTDETIVTVALVPSDKFGRLHLIPEALGEATITISDGDGKTAVLKVKVGEYGKRMKVNSQGIIVTGDVPEGKKAEIIDAMKETFPVLVNGGFELVSEEFGSWKDKGTLRIYRESFEKIPVIGSYGWKAIMVNGKEKPGFSFLFNDKEYLFTTSIEEDPKTRENIVNSLTLYEDVTSECTVECPAGVNVYRGYKLQIGSL